MGEQARAARGAPARKATPQPALQEKTTKVLGLPAAQRALPAPAVAASGAPAIPPGATGANRSWALRAMQDSSGNAWVRRMLDGSAPRIQRACDCGDAEATDAGCAVCRPEHAAVPPSVTDAMRSGGGQPLEGATRARMERAFGADFGGVRVHTGAPADRAASDINARSFTTGQDIFFAAGRYRPGTPDGDKLVAHELTHTLQQGSGAATVQSAGQISRPGDPLEQEAREAEQGRTAIAGRSPTPTIFRQDEEEPGEQQVPYHDLEFLYVFAEKIKQDLRAEMRQVVLPTGSRFTAWVNGSNAGFIDAVLSKLLEWQELQWPLHHYLPPAAVNEAIRRGRDIGPIETHGLGGREYSPGVALELRSLLARQLALSLARIAPRYLAARNQAALAEQARTNRAPPSPPQPDPADIVASAPTDRLVIPALLAGTVTVDLAAYRAANPGERRVHAIQRLRIIAEGDWRFEAVQGLWSWIRVLRPADATAEEVANLLYRDETQSDRIVPAPPYFGFDPDRLHGAMLKRWEALSGEDDDDIKLRILRGVPAPEPGQRETTLQHGYDVMRPAAVELLYSAQADDISLIQARDAKPTGASRAEIVSRLTVSLKLLGHSAADAKRFGLDFEPARTRLKQRLDAFQATADPRLVYRWDAQSIEQLSILQRAVTGLRVAATHHAAMAQHAPATEPVGEPSDYRLLVTPVLELGKAYVEVIRISELLVTANQKLGEADERAKRLLLDFAEARLQIMRRTLTQMTSNKMHPGQRKSPADLEKSGYADLIREESRLRHEVAGAREKLATDPDAALGQLKQLAPAFAQLQLGVQLGGVFESIVQLMVAVEQAREGSGGLGSIFTGGEYRVELSRILLWGRRWKPLYDRYRKGEAGTRQFKADLRDLGENPEWKNLFKSVTDRLRDLRQREAWINFVGHLVALVAIAMVTAGVGVVAEGVGLGFWSVAGIEALTFTTLTLPFEEKASVEGFFLHFFENWLTFSLAKGASLLYEAAVGEKFAKTLLGKGVGGLANFATATSFMIVQAEIDSVAHRQGRALSESEIKGIIGESTAVTLATILAARYAKPFLTELRVRGEAFGGELAAIDAMRAQNLALTETVHDTKSNALAKELSEADARQAAVESQVLRKLAQDGVNAKDSNGRPLSPEQREVVIRLTKAEGGKPAPLAEAVAEQAGVARARMLVELEPEGPELFLTDPGKDIIDYAKRFHEAGAAITGPEYSADGTRSILVDFKDGHPFEVMERAPQATMVTRPAEAPPHATADVPASGASKARVAEPVPEKIPQQRAAEVVPEAQAQQERAADAARDAERAQAQLVDHASTKIEPRRRRALIKQYGERLLEASQRELAAKTAEGKALTERTDRMRRQIADLQKKRDHAGDVEPGKRKTSEQIDKERASITKKIARILADIEKLDPRARQLSGEISRLNEQIRSAKNMIDGRKTHTLPCFPPGTPVWTPAGPVSIERIADGAAVTCWDEERGQQRSGWVTTVHRHRTQRLYRIVTEAGVVDATGGHRFFVEQAGWTAAREISAGMRLRARDGAAMVHGVSAVEQDTATYNLSVDPCPTYFVGPGLLVHNAGDFNLGDLFIYEGYNEKFPDLIYIGQTNDLLGRQEKHQAEGRKGLKEKFLTERERLFFEFKATMKLRVRPGLTGLNKLTARYFEQVNLNWEREVRGEEKVRGEEDVMNRIDVVAEKKWKDLVNQVTELHCQGL